MAQRGRRKQELRLSFLKATLRTCVAELNEKTGRDKGKVNKTWHHIVLPRSDWDGRSQIYYDTSFHSFVIFKSNEVKKQNQTSQLRKGKDFARCLVEEKEFKAMKIWAKELFKLPR